MSLLSKNYNPVWDNFLTDEIKKLLSSIEVLIGKDYSPVKDKVLRFLEVDFSNIKIVILGQDPYPQSGRATGRAFEVGDLEAWDSPFRQVSLKNFIRLIYKSTMKIEDYKCIPSFSDIVLEIKDGRFPLASPQLLSSNIEKQGVLFLNTSFTVYPGKALSHVEIWQPFTHRLILWMSKQNPDLIWFLWGKRAIAYKKIIQNGKFYESRHPMMCSFKNKDDFLKSKCISETMHMIDWTGNRKN